MECPVDHQRTIEDEDDSLMWVNDQSSPAYRRIAFKFCPNCGENMTGEDLLSDDAFMELFGNVKEQLDRLSVITANLSKGEG